MKMRTQFPHQFALSMKSWRKNKDVIRIVIEARRTVFCEISIRLLSYVIDLGGIAIALKGKYEVGISWMYLHLLLYWNCWLSLISRLITALSPRLWLLEGYDNVLSTRTPDSFSTLYVPLLKNEKFVLTLEEKNRLS